MALLRVRRASQITIPAEVRAALKVKEGDYLEARVVRDGVLLKPMSVVSRKQAWKDVERAVSQVRDTAAKRRPDPKRDEEAIAREVKKSRGG